MAAVGSDATPGRRLGRPTTLPDRHMGANGAAAGHGVWRLHRHHQSVHAAALRTDLRRRLQAVVAHALRLTHRGPFSVLRRAAVYLNNSCMPKFRLLEWGRLQGTSVPRCRSRPPAAVLELPTASVRASGSASVRWTRAPIERLLFARTQWPVAFACPTMPAARQGTVPDAHCNHDAPRRMAEDTTVRNGRPHHHFDHFASCP